MGISQNVFRVFQSRAAMTLSEGQVLSSAASEDSPSGGSCQCPGVLVAPLLSGVTRRLVYLVPVPPSTWHQLGSKTWVMVLEKVGADGRLAEMIPRKLPGRCPGHSDLL